PSLWFLTKCLDEEFYILVWTTTPWTLFGNRAFAFSPIMEYLFAKVDGKVVVFGKENAERIREELGWEWEVLRVESGKYFEYKKFQHPLFSDMVSLGILADFVSSEEGSGIVHIAPGHGKEDYEVGKIYNLEVFSPVDEVGNFTQDADRQTKYPLNVAGKSIEEGGERAIERLKELGFFVKLGKYRHSYPHDWRYKKPLIFRATGQWFLSVDHQNLRERALKAIKEDVRWHPEESINRIYMSVKERPDWVISRQRAWGVFIPAVKCKDCGEVILDPEIVRNLAKKIREGNSDAWLTEDIKEFLPENFTCKNCNGRDFEKEYDILDVWFDSGSTNIAVLDRRGIGWPADVYLEGWDQHRGWFNASLMIGMAAKEKPPYRAVITHGFVLDHLGRAMHKSLGNVVSPQEVIGKYGADVLRLWVASSDYTEDIRIGDEIMARVVDAYRKIRNTYRYLLSNLYDFDKPLEYFELLPIDRWALSKLYTLVKDCREHYENFAFEKVFRDAYNFIVNMSSFYFEALKDRLYTYAPKSRERRSAQTSLYYILYHLLMIFAPIIPHTVEEAWGFSPFKENSESAFLEVWKDLPESFRDEELEREFEVILRMRDEVYPILEVLRRERKVIGQNLDARIEVKPKGDYGRILEKYKPYLVEIVGVSQFLITDNPKGEESLDGEYGLWKVSHALGKKCPRCWMWFEEEFEEVCSKCSKALGEIHLI
ncbi:class I tRNA ligase family protein, partial [Candidatus Caldipriscus sp.]|nr:class I tRNA ligase family protein [Candidatus Caldipriscus sp.]